MASVFKTKPFKDLFNEWNQKLKDSGFEDIEDFSLPDPPLKQWEKLKFKNVTLEEYNEKQEYFRLAKRFLETHAFLDPIHRLIWKRHCKGYSVRKIAQEIELKKFSKSTVSSIIKQLRAAM